MKSVNQTLLIHYDILGQAVCVKQCNVCMRKSWRLLKILLEIQQIQFPVLKTVF